AGMQQWLSIVAGVLIILIVIVPQRTFARYNFSRPVFQLVSRAKSAMGMRLKNPSLPSLFAIGTLNGLLPCAMVYAALFGALATQDVLSGGLYMVFFGLGTEPLMSSVSYLSKMMTIPLRSKL